MEDNKFNTDKELLAKVYELCEANKVSNTDFFEIAYRALIKKTKGPRLASLILSIGQDKVIEILNTFFHRIRK